MLCFIYAAKKPPLTVTHITSMSDLKRAALTIASFMQYVPKGMIADYLLVMPPQGLNAHLCSVKPSNFNLYCVDELQVLNTTKSDVRKFYKKVDKNDPTTSHNT